MQNLQENPPPPPALPFLSRAKRALFSRLHIAPLIKRRSGPKVAFGERNNYGINPFYVTVDIANADVCLNFNDCPVLPFLDGSVDTLFTSHALEHLLEERVRLFLKEANRVLRPGGRLIAELPDCQYLYDQWRAGERDLFNEFVFDEEICRQVGHPEIHSRKDIAFANVISCMNGKNSKGEYQHMPVYFESAAFEEKIAGLNMDDFFAWLISLQSDQEKLSGGHVSAWYPSKFESALTQAGFKSVGQPVGVDPFLFRGGVRQTYSFRTMATKSSSQCA